MDSVPPQCLTIFFSRQWSTVITYQGFICSPSSRSAFLRSYLVHGLHADDDVLLAVPVDVPADARLEVLADAVQLLGRRHRVGKLDVHVGVLRRVEAPDDDRVSVRVEEVLPVGGPGEGERLPAHRPRQQRLSQTDAN